jgi:hypothetical protein
MKRLAIITICGSILGGCVGTQVKVSTDPLEVKVNRLAVLYWASVPDLYNGGPDGDSIKAVADEAIKAAAASAAKGSAATP